MTSYTVQDDRLIEYYMKMAPFLTYARHTRSEKHCTLNMRKLALAHQWKKAIPCILRIHKGVNF